MRFRSGTLGLPSGSLNNREKGAVMAQTSLPTISAGENGLNRYLAEIRRFPMLEPQEEYMLAKAVPRA
jgi:DNA-directed RNA polymerase sigma subunit (sigma70/sigma32)